MTTMKRENLEERPATSSLKMHKKITGY